MYLNGCASLVSTYLCYQSFFLCAYTHTYRYILIFYVNICRQSWQSLLIRAHITEKSDKSWQVQNRTKLISVRRKAMYANIWKCFRLIESRMRCHQLFCFNICVYIHAWIFIIFYIITLVYLYTYMFLIQNSMLSAKDNKII